MGCYRTRRPTAKLGKPVCTSPRNPRSDCYRPSNRLGSALAGGRGCRVAANETKVTTTMSSKDPNNDERRYSSVMVDGVEQAPSRAMLRAVGFTDEDFTKSQIGIASTWSMVTPCNMHIDQLADQAAAGADEAGGKAVQFNTITVSDGISMGTPGMRYSLVSREVIADSIETVVAGEGFDGFVAIGGCDKNMPACAMAIARLDRRSSCSKSSARPSRGPARAAECTRRIRWRRRSKRWD